MKILVTSDGTVAAAGEITDTGETYLFKDTHFPKTLGLAIHEANEVPPDAVGKYRYVDGSFQRLPDPAEEIQAAKDKKLAALASLRYEKEIAGIVVNGIMVKTDRESQAMLIGAKVLMDLNPAKLLDWKGKNGWAKLNKAAVEAMGNAIGNHVQSCFAKERIHAEAISALTTIEDVEAYDIATNW